MPLSLRILLVFVVFGPCLANAQSPSSPTQSPAPPAQGPTLSFVDPTVRLLAGSQDGTSEISLRSSTDLSSPPILTDKELPHPPAAIVKFEPGEATPSKNIWRYRVRVSGLTPASTTQQRYAEIWGYKITSAPILAD
ncbi:MAG TPA: hypothetical protein VJ023_15265 [Pyrinomonadaceae bacterium]|nr:hypothetical protein [Pyrinomonadaceae bacterium]